jgi:hypothetical protein
MTRAEFRFIQTQKKDVNKCGLPFLYFFLFLLNHHQSYPLCYHRSPSRRSHTPHCYLCTLTPSLNLYPPLATGAYTEGKDSKGLELQNQSLRPVY